MAQASDRTGDALRQLAILNRVARIAVEDMALRPMLQRIVDTLAREFDWEFLACVGIDAERREFVCEAVHSRVDSEVAVGYRRALGSGVVGECALGGRTIDIDDVAGHPNFVDTLHGTRSELCVPVVHRGQVLAVLNAESRRPGAFQGQRVLLETVADQLAGVIRAARLLDELQRANGRLESLSLQDALTGIANRRQFDAWMAAALERSARLQRPLALLLLDVDHFKDFNDGYGHPAGDACLKEIAALLSGLLAGTSARLARYGGEEFVVLLPDADLASALALAGQLRMAVEQATVEHRYCDGGLVTLSIGVAAAVPAETGGADTLLVPADTALYDAKRSGRNCVRPVAAVPGTAMP